ncbi:hypothetical protein QBC43DRAFT_291783 [Cladorrhinum sp. PSN259]|nr:hypothetical protein QBC43DRAFT_291783 [Cladorrhinum sp. PSN259]
MDPTRPSPVLPWELICLIIDKVDSISPPTTTTTTTARTWIMATATGTTIPTSTNTKIQSRLLSLLLTSPYFHKPLLPKLYTRIHLTTPAQIAQYLLAIMSSSSVVTAPNTTDIYVSAPLSLSILPPPEGNPWLAGSTWTMVLSALKTLTHLLQSRYGYGGNSELDYPLNNMMSNLAEIEMRALLSSHSHSSHGSLHREGGNIDTWYLTSSDISYDTTYLSTLLIGMLFLFAPANLQEIWPSVHESREGEYDDDTGSGSVSWNFDYNLRGMLAWFCSGFGGEELKERIRRVRVKGYKVDRRRSAVGRPKLMFRGFDHGMEGVLNVC